MNSKELLLETEKAIGDGTCYTKHMELINLHRIVKETQGVRECVCMCQSSWGGGGGGGGGLLPGDSSWSWRVGGVAASGAGWGGVRG